MKTMSRVHPIVAALDRRTVDLDIKPADLARALGVDLSSVRSWRSGRRTPAYVYVARWAEHVGLTLGAVAADRRVVASGPDLPSRFRELRTRAGRSQSEVGARRRVRGGCVASMEHGRRAHPGLCTVDDHLAALDLRLTLFRAAIAGRGPGACSVTTTAPFPSGLIRPWYPGHVPASSTTGAFEAHIARDCERLLAVRPEPVEGCGWLDPADPALCPICRDDEDDDK